MSSSKRSVKRSRPLLGTFVEITVEGRRPIAFLNHLIDEGFKTVATVEHRMSYFRPDSDIGRLNTAKPGVWLKSASCTRAVLAAANDVFHRSKGIFDPRKRDGKIFGAPIEIRGTRIRKNGPWIYDLGGIAKGFAVDQAIERIAALDSAITTIVVNAGGDLRIQSKQPQKIGTRIRGTRRTRLATFQLNSGAMATSDASRHDHTRSRLKRRTVSVFSNRCLLADALTKVVTGGSPALIKKCLAGYGARAVTFGPFGAVEQVFGHE